MSRMEWLALETMHALRLAMVASDASTMSSVATLIGAAWESITLALVWTPHKMCFDGEGFHSGPAGANDRADFHLVACVGSRRSPQVLCTLYHTTNVPLNSASGRPNAVLFESRLLFRGRSVFCNLMDGVIKAYASALCQRRGFSTELRTLEEVPLVVEQIPDSDDDGDAEEEEQVVYHRF